MICAAPFILLPIAACSQSVDRTQNHLVVVLDLDFGGLVLVLFFFAAHYFFFRRLEDNTVLFYVRSWPIFQLDVLYVLSSPSTQAEHETEGG